MSSLSESPAGPSRQRSPPPEYEMPPPTRIAPQQLRRKRRSIVDCHYVLTHTFGHSEFKGKQGKICDLAVQGADIFVLAPTGMGKSICFQVPAVADAHGVTIVVSPLLSLMKNQVSKLRTLEVAVASYTSETTPEEKKEACTFSIPFHIVKQLKSGHPLYRLLYITPESLCNDTFMGIVQKVYDNQELNRLVIDEAHCLSEWGHDFRPDYRKLRIFRQRFPDTPIMALTATATPEVQADITELLGLDEQFLYKVVHNFNRPNLFYEIRYSAAPNEFIQMTEIHETISTLHRKRKQPSSGIIYCRTRAMCDTMSAFLRGKGINARPFHRGIASKTLDITLTQWELGGYGDGAVSVDVVVATIAFGMGIDKSNVRYIIHYDLPKTLEGYYQETGRAGRDGIMSRCIMYYSREDYLRVKRWGSKSRNNASLAALLQFCENIGLCRHIAICRYFGEEIDDKDDEMVKLYCGGMCDVCRNPERVKQRKTLLSSEEYASTQIVANTGNGSDEDEDGYPRQRASSAWNGNNKSRKRPLSTGPAPAPFKRSSTGQLGMQRAGVDNGGPSKRAKPARDPMPPLLITRPHSSLGSLFKPFKLPTMVTRTAGPSARAPRTPSPPPIRSPSPRHTPPLVAEDDELIEIESDPSRVDDAQMLVDSDEAQDDTMPDIRSSSPVNVPEVDFALDISTSAKVPHATRKEGCKRIHRTLYKVFASDDKWAKMQYPPPSTEAKNAVLTGVSEVVECSAQSMCVTSDGYAVRVEDAVASIRLLSREEAWGTEDIDEYEDAREIVTILQRMCTRQKKGKPRS